jgi:hypothetical protein
MSIRISRRTLLRGAGAAIALPLLDQMLPEGKAFAAGTPKRRVFMAIPNGVHMASWRPSTFGAGYAATPILQALLAAHRANVSVVSNAAMPFNGAFGHGEGAASLFAMKTLSSSGNAQASVTTFSKTVDQFAADALGASSRFRSLALGAGYEAPFNDIGPQHILYSLSYRDTNASSVLPVTVNPVRAFDRLFQVAPSNDPIAQKEAARRIANRKSVLDAVTGQASALQGRLGSADRKRVDEYLTGVRELERQVQASAGGSTCTAPTRPSGRSDFPSESKLMMDLLVMALRCDLTRVATFMLHHPICNSAYPFAGVSEVFHDRASHYNQSGRGQAGINDYVAICKWEIDQYAYLLSKLAMASEAGGTVLDNSAVFLSSEINEGEAHGNTNMPVLIGGKLGGALHPGQHIDAGGASLKSLYLGLLQGAGVPMTSVATDESRVFTNF